jgi:hypothetical protein
MFSTAMRNRLAIDARRGGLGLAALVVLVSCTYLALPGVAEAISFLLPGLLLLAALVGRQYPGERTLLAIIHKARRRARSAVSATVGRSRPRALLPRGGDLLATSLAVRPPPLAATVPS